MNKNAFDLPYTLCFIRQGERFLMLNRKSPPNMGLWNGVGGKIDPGETPEQSALREAYEETGIALDQVVFKGIVTWKGAYGVDYGGAYVYLAELPKQKNYPTPKRMLEGVLEWKKLSWILDEDNLGVVPNIPLFLPIMLREMQLYDHRCVFEGKQMVGFDAVPLPCDR